MSNNQENYGFGDDTPKTGQSLNFGLNQGVTRMTQFGFNPNGGANGATQEVLDVKFEIAGKEVNYRIFPVKKAFTKDNVEITDPSHEAFKAAVQEVNATVVHILRAFVSLDQIKAALSVPINSFQQFCNVSALILPADYNKKRLDVFGQYQWRITGENTRTFVNLPKNVKHGRWLCASVVPQGSWKKTDVNGGLAYIDDAGNKHPFERNAWYINSAFAHVQKEDTIDDITAPSTGTDTESTNSDWV